MKSTQRRRPRSGPNTLAAALPALAVVLGLAWGAGKAAAADTSAEPARPPIAQAGDPKVRYEWKSMVDWLAATQVPSYEAAAAHEPYYQDKALWPSLGGKELFVTQSWPKARVYTWAHPGQSGGEAAKSRRPILDVQDPGNWLVDGRPAEAVKFGLDVDLVLPPADKPYSVTTHHLRAEQAWRHVTIGRNATLLCGGDGSGRQWAGNLWIKRGGKTYGNGAGNFVGRGHTFCRDDNVAPKDDGRMISQYLMMSKNDASVEFLGDTCVLDEFNLHAGSTMIVGPGSRFLAGRGARPTLRKGSVLALLDGACWGVFDNTLSVPDLTIEPTAQLLGGLPDRPLHRQSPVLPLNFKNYLRLDAPGHRYSDRNYIFMSLLVRGTIRTYSTDLARYHLVLTYAGDNTANGWDERPDTWSDSPASAWYRSLPRAIDVLVGKGATIQGVAFEHLRRGGIMLEDPADRANLKDLTFGRDCEAPGEASFGSPPVLGKGAR